MKNLSEDEQDVLQIASRYLIVAISFLQADTIYRAGRNDIPKLVIDSLKQKGLLMQRGKNYELTPAGRKLVELQ